MYAVATPVSLAWEVLFDLVAEYAGVEMEYVEHAAPAPVSTLWARPDCGCVFMCGYPYAIGPAQRQLLAAPVPAAARYQNRPVYFTEFIVRTDSPAQTLQQTFDSRLACMLPESNSGYNAPRHFLMQQAAAGRHSLYRPAARMTPTPRETIEAVIGGQADVGVVDSYVLDLLRRYAPEVTAQVRTLAQTQASPIPPLIASAQVDANLCNRIRGSLLEIHHHRHAAALMEFLGLSHFVAAQTSDYACLPALAQEADRAGFSLTEAEIAS
jgi:ABC-type phosphate/phosphonate transport system substrate-binding protein